MLPKQEVVAMLLAGGQGSRLGVLREFDSLGVEAIYSESFSRDHLGQAIMNRLTKAAGYHIIKV